MEKGKWFIEKNGMYAFNDDKGNFYMPDKMVEELKSQMTYEEACMFFGNAVIENKKLKEENKELNKKYLDAVADYEYEKYKNSRAIEYIENYHWYYLELKEILLSILKGEE